MEYPGPTLYAVKREADRWLFVPSPTFAHLMIGAFGAGSAFIVYLSALFFFPRTDVASTHLLLGAILLLAAGLSASMGICAWRTRHTPLNIEFGGRVSYDGRELCSAGTVRAVRIGPSHRGEVGDCEVYLELTGGKLVSIPSQYFGRFKAREHARPFAADLAEALGVQITESH
jgi:hypothetical protein